jgi:hypothetical protein
MSGPYCKTCVYYSADLMQPSGGPERGTCGDPTKIISHGICGPMNEPPEVIAESYTCRNHTNADGSPEWRNHVS